MRISHPMRAIAVSSLTLVVSAMAQPSALADSPSGPRLVVLIVIDQLRADLVTRWESDFGEGGFERIMKQGAHFPNAYYSYACSATAPGHATVSTGRTPRGHGIISNAWFRGVERDRQTSSVYDKNHSLVGTAQPDDATGGKSPHMLIGPALGDQMKFSDRRAKVFSVGFKDRAAIFLGGQRPDLALWWNTTDGKFVSSTYYAKALPSYTKAFNDRNPVERFIGKSWGLLLPAERYEDCHPVKGSWPGFSDVVGVGFPHQMPDTHAACSRAIWSAPFANELVFDMAEEMLINESLGADEAADLLCIGLSANDVCGHRFGPDSAEVKDCTLRTDRQLAVFFDLLDKEIGLDRCIIAITGDHGATTAPALAQELGMGGGRFEFGELRVETNKAIAKALDAANPQFGDYVSWISQPWIYFGSAYQRADAATQQRVVAATRSFLKQHEGIRDVIDVAEVSRLVPPPNDLSRSLIWQNCYPGRVGDLCLVPEPYWYLMTKNLAGHTSMTNHDRHVPILILGPGVRHGRFHAPVKPSDLAVTIASILGIEPPLGATGQVMTDAIE